MGTRWDSETTIKFIEEYKSHEFLWNPSKCEYKNKHLRQAANQEIAVAMNIPDFGIQDVKNKIKNLRSTYSQEIKKIEDYKKSGFGYKSNLRWLKDFESLLNKDVDKKITQDFDPVIPVLDETSNVTDVNPLETERVWIVDEVPKNKQSNCSLKTPPRPKKKVKYMKSLHRLMNSKTEEDSFDIFGKSVAMQLKKLTGERALLAQSKIQNVLTEFGIEDLQEMKRSTSPVSICSNATSNSSASTTHSNFNIKEEVTSTEITGLLNYEKEEIEIASFNNFVT